MDSNMYGDILKQNLMPCPHFRNWAKRHDNDPKHTTKMTTALLGKLKVMKWPSMSPLTCLNK